MGKMHTQTTCTVTIQQVESKMSEGKRGKSLQSSARKIVLKVSNFIQEKVQAGKILQAGSSEGAPPIPIKNWLKRSSDCLGISQASIKRIRKDAKDGKELKTPGKSRPRKCVKTDLDDFDLAVIRRRVHAFMRMELFLLWINFCLM